MFMHNSRGNKWQDERDRSPGDARVVIIPNACGSNDFWRRAPRSREPLARPHHGHYPRVELREPRQLDKVRGEWSLMALCYNFSRVLRIIGLGPWMALLAQRAA